MSSARSPRRYDVVVVGAGSAGCVLAARLSEEPSRHVLLVEAGPDDIAADDAAALSGSSFVEAMHVSTRRDEHQDVVRADGQPAEGYLRGRGVGGSSAINAMVALPGHPDDYDEWARDHGCTGWSWADVEPWFSRTALTMRRAERAEWGAIATALAAAEPTAARGVSLTRDAAGRRVGVREAYLDPARARANLHIRADAQVDEVLIDRRRAVGVRLGDGEEIEAGLVIVSSGAIGSPTLLLRSAVDTPGIGDNLHDHPAFPVTMRRHDPAEPNSLAVATVATCSSSAAAADLQLLPVEYVDPDDRSFGVVMAAAMRVHSRGRLALSVGNAGQPTVHLGMLDDERDVDALAAAIDALERVLAHPAMAGVAVAEPYDRSEAGMRASLGQYVHAAGTCAMGTVVDPSCRVFGYEGLVVCDASVMPNLPRANPHLPTVMIAERIAAATDALLRT